eukprot:3110389-Rhodomonas_salina.3
MEEAMRLHSAGRVCRTGSELDDQRTSIQMYRSVLVVAEVVIDFPRSGKAVYDPKVHQTEKNMSRAPDSEQADRGRGKSEHVHLERAWDGTEYASPADRRLLLHWEEGTFIEQVEMLPVRFAATLNISSPESTHCDGSKLAMRKKTCKLFCLTASHHVAGLVSALTSGAPTPDLPSQRRTCVPRLRLSVFIQDPFCSQDAWKAVGGSILSGKSGRARPRHALPEGPVLASQPP